MSRGLGPVQRRALGVLREVSADGGMPADELRAALGGDGSNARRAVRGLVRRGLIEESTVGGKSRVELIFWGAISAMPPLPDPPDPLAELRALREAAGQARALIEERAALKAQQDASWVRYEYRPIRRRRLGANQERVLAVLLGYAEPMDEGLPVRAVKAIVGGDRSNARRAIRSLLLRGRIEESEDARSIRLARSVALWFSLFPPVLLETIDEERAKTILLASR